MTKVCVRCGTEKPLDLFSKGKAYKDGRRGTCKKCHSDYQSEYMKKNPDKYAEQLKRNSYTKANWKRHRITEDAYNELMDLHDGNCHACKERPAINIDHDHACCPKRFSCGKCVRGVLCLQCNTAIGLLSDSVVIFQRVIAYIS